MGDYISSDCRWIFSDTVKLIEFPDSMDSLLGKVIVAYLGDLYLNYDELKIFNPTILAADRRIELTLT